VISIWLIFQLAAVFGLGVPIILTIWSWKRQDKSILKLMNIYWRVSSLFFISIFLLIGKRELAFITSLLSVLLMVSSTWFWVDINEELNEFPTWKPIAITTRIWRYTLLLFGIIFSIKSFYTIDCFIGNFNDTCLEWFDPPQNIFFIFKNIFKFLFGANFTALIATYIGYLALFLYLIGIIQWLFIKFPKNGRYALLSKNNDF
tara:strand:+ start:2408 stop:3016 length:609 start_codon:yes stop_codon:yes gene_type:complete